MKYAPLRCGALYPSRVAEVWCFQGALNADGSFGPCHLVLLIAWVARVKKQVRFQFWRNWVTGHRGHWKVRTPKLLVIRALFFLSFRLALWIVLHGRQPSWRRWLMLLPCCESSMSRPIDSWKFEVIQMESQLRAIERGLSALWHGGPSRPALLASLVELYERGVPSSPGRLFLDVVRAKPCVRSKRLILQPGSWEWWDGRKVLDVQQKKIYVLYIHVPIYINLSYVMICQFI